MIAIRVIVFLAGLAAVVATLDAAIRTFVLPRPASVSFSRLIGLVLRWTFDRVAHERRSFEARDRALALYAPLMLLLFPAIWLVVILLGYTAMFWAVRMDGFRDAFSFSGSSLFTLGFRSASDAPDLLLIYSEAMIGLALLALLISYLPSIYTAFSRREIAVSQLSVRAGTPPSAVELLERAHRAGFLDDLDEYWSLWELWFVELEETHTSIAPLCFLRSSNPKRSWLTASGAVLDAAALRYAALDLPWSPHAGVCIRSGFQALRAVADFFDVPHDPDPAPTDPISITREEFEAVLDRLAAAGLAMKPDRDQAWRDFSGWRVNYDTVLIALCGMILAPEAQWSGDRAPRGRDRHRAAIRRSRR